MITETARFMTGNDKGIILSLRRLHSQLVQVLSDNIIHEPCLSVYAYYET